ncbi:MAG: type II toxin-antitoxin system prevent-host-death family antitoxin [Actinobacteria bacterium]|nr:type II toxin-antitoxin system prevent-host-death family antitoxin [Actinomycetota bacterium]
MEVGIRELRDHLSRYLEQVGKGEEVVVTEHGRAVARIISIDGGRKLDRLIAEGLVTPAVDRTRRLPKRRVRATGSVSGLVAEQRR